MEWRARVSGARAHYRVVRRVEERLLSTNSKLSWAKLWYVLNGIVAQWDEADC